MDTGAASALTHMYVSARMAPALTESPSEAGMHQQGTIRESPTP